MAHIFIDVTILLQHRSQISKGIFLRYHLSIKANLILLVPSSTKIAHHVLSFSSTKSKTLRLQDLSPQLQFFINPIRLSSTSTTSSTNSIHYGISPCISFVTSSITKAKR
uniref:Uncharacterized protein n=1 Tax=Arundo donax TaxID=35708 RepID=A0A0A9HSW1_ARUDO